MANFFQYISNKIASNTDNQSYQQRKILRNTVPDDCFGHCALVQHRKNVVASQFPVSEYMDNISRVGKMILKSRLHEHKKCFNKCLHSYVLDWRKKP